MILLLLLVVVVVVILLLIFSQSDDRGVSPRLALSAPSKPESESARVKRAKTDPPFLARCYVQKQTRQTICCSMLRAKLTLRMVYLRSAITNRPTARRATPSRRPASFKRGALLWGPLQGGRRLPVRRPPREVFNGFGPAALRAASAIRASDALPRGARVRTGPRGAPRRSAP